MKYKLLIVFSLLALNSCKNQDKEKTFQEAHISANNPNTENISEQPMSDCEEYWKNRYKNDSLKTEYINQIISKNKLTVNNLIFLNALKSEKQNDYAFKQVLSPIFRLSNTEIGILTFPKYNLIENKFIPVSKEMDLIKKHDTVPKNTMEHFGKIKFYPILLNSILNTSAKPKTYYYTTNKVGSTQIMELGAYVDECLEYFEYSIDTTTFSKNDKLLFSSPFLIDLIFENNPQVDLHILNDYKNECFDCPTNLNLQKSFAKIKGTNNLYFVYADSFPINNELDTPSRALIYINENNEPVYLWYEEIDLFGCSCL
ncbi:hypothetical protein [Mariniflexile sp. AS56]|uniref:hypothetical protein n=1 Tax=Mariniflexile sp. AS56 TaxID=3063957 RepID=UPI0026EC4BC8|nr:hypothetical protein [Mariniflexile sp. AS56]MDO7173040.1 hypothetical protein [Mariniflexile sp. AS56]